jgi:prepilin-type N-terminal cleavage/methylation domain-containing protein
MATRRGFTLIEIMISLVIMMMVMGAVYKLILSSQRLARGQAERITLQSNVRVGSLAVLNDLRELNTATGGLASDNDILEIDVSRIKYRGMRGAGIICQAPAINTHVRISRSSFSGYRDPVATRDSLYVFIDGDPDTETDDAWLPVAITDVSTAAACPPIGGVNQDGITITTPATPALVALPSGTPVRIFEMMELKLHQADGQSWLGARSISAGEAVQPVLGPLANDSGFVLTYLNAAGGVTADPTAIKSIQVTLRGLSEGAVNTGIEGVPSRVQEALVSQILLRNSFRP